MKTIFVLVGLLFDLIILAVACFVIYCAVQPDFFYYSVDFVEEYFDTNLGRLKLVAGAVVFILLAFRGLFLLALGRGDSVFVIKRDERGTLSVSRATLEQLIGQLAGNLQPPSDVEDLSIVQTDGGLKINLKIRLDLSKCNLGEYTSELDNVIRTYFQESLGVQVKSMDIQALANPGTQARLPVPVSET